MRRVKFLIRLAAAGAALVLALGLMLAPRQVPEATWFYPGKYGHLSNRIALAAELNDETPTARDDADSTNEDVPVQTEVTANDEVPNFNITLRVHQQPSHGSAVPLDKKIITYTPEPNFHGVDSYRYQICSNNGGGCSEAEVVIIVYAVNDPPTAVDDTATTDENTPVAIAVLDNDSDVEGDVLFLQGFDQVSSQGGSLQRDDNGTPLISSDDGIIYSPPQDYSGSDTFHYVASDGSGQSSAQVTVTIMPQEEPDTEAPTVTWLSPVGDEEVYYANDEMVVLEIQVSDDQGIEKVEYNRWDVPTQSYIALATLTAAPYRFELDVGSLNLGWNQVNARAFDTAGNASDVGHIWIFKTMQVFLPLAAR